MREGEVHGVDYYFMTEVEFELGVSRGEFLEWSKAYGHYYGTPKAVLEDLAQGVSCVLIIDRGGARQLVSNYPHAVLIWIYVKSVEVLRTRLVQRGVNSDTEIERRLGLALREFEEEKNTSFYLYYILNEDFEQALSNLEEIFIKELAFERKEQK